MPRSVALLLAIGGVAALQAPCPSVPSAWTQSNGKCFWYSGNFQKSWTGAQDYCSKIGGNLAGTYNTTDLALVLGLISNPLYSTWSGLNKPASSWSFLDKTSTFYLSKQWIPGEPEDGKGTCGALRTASPSGYYALSCSYVQPFVCSQKIATCDSKNFTSSTGSLSSPGYPNEYSNNENCVQHIIAKPNLFITLTFDAWIVENKYDVVLIYDGYGPGGDSRLIANITSDPTNSTTSPYKNAFQSTTNIMSVQFVTDGSITKKGWHANYVAKVYSDPVHQTGASGTLTSPNFPGDYYNDAEQLFYVNTANGTQINAVFTYFDTEAARDYICVYDGPDVYSPLLGNFSGHGYSTTNEPGPLQTSSNALTLYFYTDYSLTYKGFSIDWNIF